MENDILINIKNAKKNDLSRLCKELNCGCIKNEVVSKIDNLDTIELIKDFDSVAEIIKLKNGLEFKKQQKISDLTEPYKELLKNSDYKAIKYAEGHITENSYLSIKEERQQYRDEINNIESLINNCSTIEELETLEV